ncbi:M14 family metallopeptidase [Flammeovirgaceae bacterium SG7u.111]|nr:M14 family metallopeptidase [Flammeovirgaceae bacterium SG7u.132]WPO34157.1 M14 family metallopeptidase [Flammeovirgaceae bacterium SG7u.111]
MKFNWLDRLVFPLLAMIILVQCQPSESPQSASETDWETVFEKSKGLETVTYQQGIEYYKKLDEAFAEIKMLEMGETDSGEPLHLVLFSKDKSFDIGELKKAKKAFLLINNAIHPGETDGVDASMMLLRDVAQGKVLGEEMGNVVLAIIPFYNIGGALNRGNFSRANQIGPKEHGFRGNARNYDLNRDFIKNDTKNARSFAQLFHYVDPDFMIDTHVSNGADYQYTLTLISTQKEKLGGVLKDYQEEKLVPYLFDYMEENSSTITPYVNVHGGTPDNGFTQFPDWPRYSSGYVTLFNTIGFMSETHMLKPYPQRVEATYQLLKGLATVLARDRKEVIALRAATKEAVAKQKVFPVSWENDTSAFRMLQFKGYEGSMIESKIAPGQKRLFYDRSKPFTKEVKYFDTYKTAVEVTAPQAYIIPQGWHNVIGQLELNEVEMYQLESDSAIEVESYFIDEYKSYPRPYEGHFMHYNVKLRPEKQTITFRKGDYVVPVNQVNNRYIVETLEPEGVDSFFNWNYFDTILQQKEGYSSYVFEDIAFELLKTNKKMAEEFEKKKSEDSEFAASRRAQLNFIYQHSPFYEKEHMRYPVFRLL